MFSIYAQQLIMACDVDCQHIEEIPHFPFCFTSCMLSLFSSVHNVSCNVCQGYIRFTCVIFCCLRPSLNSPTTFEGYGTTFTLFLFTYHLLLDLQLCLTTSVIYYDIQTFEVLFSVNCSRC